MVDVGNGQYSLESRMKRKTLCSVCVWYRADDYLSEFTTTGTQIRPPVHLVVSLCW